METSLLKTGRFCKKEHVKRPADIQNIFKNGLKVSVQGAKLFYIKNDQSFNRIGFPLPRGFGNAVERNNAKRYGREIYRQYKTHLNTGYDILFFVYPGNFSFSTRCEQFRTLCQKANLLRNKEIFL